MALLRQINVRTEEKKREEFPGKLFNSHQGVEKEFGRKIANGLENLGLILKTFSNSKNSLNPSFFFLFF